jgi:hypothetical protein
MSLGRRRFLQGSVSAGAVLLATPTGLLAEQTAAAGCPILLLRSPDDEPFALPARRTAERCSLSSIGSLALAEKLVGTPGALRTALEAHRGKTLIGLMDDRTATLLEETVRDLGGSVWCRGQHRGMLRNGAASRHVFMTTAATRGIGSALAGTLRADAAAFLVREHALCEDRGGAVQADSEPDAPWPAVLGASYARMAVGLWSPRPVIAELQRGMVADAPGSQPYVSLIAKI